MDEIVAFMALIGGPGLGFAYLRVHAWWERKFPKHKKHCHEGQPAPAEHPEEKHT
jgi:hypothetical protein